jgi:nitrate/nitrite transport system substrate-binding protein
MTHSNSPSGAPVPAERAVQGGASASRAIGVPEVRELRLGFLPLTDAAPLLVAVEKGFLAAEGLDAQAARVSSWTASRDALANGSVHAAHMLYSMPLASRLGILGPEDAPLVIPWVLSRNGQAITLSRAHAGKVGAEARALYRTAMDRRDAGRPLVFAQTLPPGTHAMWLRYWLAEGGIDPDRDVALITIPPPMMVRNMAGGRLDGFCAGEPWNAIAQLQGTGFTALTSDSLWPDHPEKVCAFRADFAQENPNTVKAVLRALHASGKWCDDPANAAELAALLARPEHLDCPAETVHARIQPGFDFGDGRQSGPRSVPIFSSGLTNLPDAAECLWFLSQYRRWGFIGGVPDYAGITTSVLRTDLYHEAMAEAGVPRLSTVRPAVRLLDGAAFDPSQPEAYAQSFAIKSTRD